MDLLFVYGTLKRDGPQHQLAVPRRIRRWSVATIQGELRDGGAYPVLVVGPQSNAPQLVRGELFFYKPDEIPLASLDDYEDFQGTAENSLFVRIRHKVQAADGLEYEAWVYVSPQPRLDLPRIARGEWGTGPECFANER